MMHHERRAIAMRVFFLVVVALLVLAFGGLEVIESHRLVDGDPPSNIPMSRTWYWK
jgi:type VI protein secretion system component VasF